MCFGGKPSYEPSPAPAVAPAPTATEMAKATAAIPPAVAIASPAPTTITAEERRKKIKAVQYGMLSTIKTSPQGLLAATETSKKKTLGE